MRLCPVLSLIAIAGIAGANNAGSSGLTGAQAAEWQDRWEQAIVEGAAKDRSCDKEMGEELGWLVSPYLNGFYQGWRLTGKPVWIDRLIEWSDAWMRRAVTEPDGYQGWPQTGSGSQFEQAHFNDSLLGEAMALRPAVLMAGAIQKDLGLRRTYGAKANAYLTMAKRIFEKWDARGAWRDVPTGGIWVVPEFGLTPGGTAWTDGYASRTVTGFSNPDNKNNLISEFVIALADATGQPLYRTRAEKWWRLMHSRLHPAGEGRYLVWNYWEPGGPWDALPNGSLKHWVGVHPNGGYYGIDVEGMVTAYQHGLVFTKADLDLLIATNRDFMWNHQVESARFGMIDGGKADPRWANSPGVLWTALLPYDATLRSVFAANHKPDGWGGLGLTAWYLATFKENQ